MDKLLFVLRAIGVLSSVFFFVLFTLPMVSSIINIGNISGATLCIWVFCMCVEPIHMAIKNVFSSNTVLLWIYRIVNGGFYAFMIYGLIVTVAMVVVASSAPPANATAVVLGAQVRPTGPSVMLWDRIEAAEKYLNENPEHIAILSGGQGKDEPMSEAEAMYQELLNKGISPDRLIKEDKSVNTGENLKFSQRIIDKNNICSDIAIVTDGFHQLRARIIASQQGIKGNVGAVNSDTSILYLPTFAVREWFAIPNQLLFRR